jgi:hypothetical protein
MTSPTVAMPLQTPDPDFRYDAFISYRHVEPDRTWARRLHEDLETFRVPADLVARGFPARLGRVFRDEEELPANADLSSQIAVALASSRFLIVVCSPRTPDSEWINSEVHTFRHLGRHDHILALLIEGTPQLSFPAALREIRRTLSSPDGDTVDSVEAVEPLAADVRPERADTPARTLRRHACLRLVACIIGCGFDDLRRREAERRVRRLRQLGILMTVAALVFFGSTLAAVLSSRDARRQRHTAEQSDAQHRMQLARVLNERGQVRVHGGDPTAGLLFYTGALKLLSDSPSTDALPAIARQRVLVGSLLQSLPLPASHRQVRPEDRLIAFTSGSDRALMADDDAVWVADLLGTHLTPPIYLHYSTAAAIDPHARYAAVIEDANPAFPFSDDVPLAHLAVVDLHTREVILRHPVRNPESVGTIQFVGEGTLLAHVDHHLLVWRGLSDRATPPSERSLLLWSDPHAVPLFETVAVSASGASIATAVGTTVRVYQADNLNLPVFETRAVSNLLTISLSPSGTAVNLVTDDDVLTRFDVATQSQTMATTLPLLHRGGEYGDHLVLAEDDTGNIAIGSGFVVRTGGGTLVNAVGQLAVLAPSGLLLTDPIPLRAPPDALAFLSSASLWAAVPEPTDRHGAVDLFEWTLDHIETRYSRSPGELTVASIAGDTCLVANADGLVAAMNMAAHSATSLPPSQASVVAMSLSPDGAVALVAREVVGDAKRLEVEERDQSVVLTCFDVRTSQPRWSRTIARMGQLMFSGDGSRFLAGGNRYAAVLSTETGVVLAGPLEVEGTFERHWINRNGSVLGLYHAEPAGSWGMALDLQTLEPYLNVEKGSIATGTTWGGTWNSELTYYYTWYWHTLEIFAPSTMASRRLPSGDGVIPWSSDDAEDAEPMKTIVEDDGIADVVPSSSGRLVAVRAVGQIRVRETVTGVPLGFPIHDSSRILHCADSGLVVTGATGEVNVWDGGSGLQLRAIHTRGSSSEAEPGDNTSGPSYPAWWRRDNIACSSHGNYVLVATDTGVVIRLSCAGTERSLADLQTIAGELSGGRALDAVGDVERFVGASVDR